MNFKANESETKLRGGYYTSQEIAKFLLGWVLVKRPESLLEPSCGDGVFFRAAMALDTKCVRRVQGFEIEPGEAVKAQAELKALDVSRGEIVTGDFLGWAREQLERPLLQEAMTFDAVVGNPPFIRYQYLDGDVQANAEAIFGDLGLRFTRHTNAWASFVLGSLALLRPGGRLAMVVPAEILHVLHAQSLRTFLASECSRVLVIDPEEIWFEGTLQGAVLLLAEKKQEAQSRGKGVAILRTRTRGFLAGDPEALFRTADFANGETIEGKWMLALLTSAERALIRDVASLPAVHRFAVIADVDVGIVTGANKFFLVPDEVVDKFDLARWAHPMFGRSEHVPGVIYDERVHQENRRAGLPTNFLWFRPEDSQALTPGAEEYIAHGEEQSLHRRYKTRIREPWYAVPSVYPSQVGMLKRSHYFPRLVLNEAGALTTDTAYRIKPRGVAAGPLVAAFVNSLTALSAELEGRHYGGGVLELVPSEIERLLVPEPQAVVVDVGTLDRRVRRGLQPWELLAAQDAQTLRPIGLTDADADSLRGAWRKLKDRRQRKESATPRQSR